MTRHRWTEAESEALAGDYAAALAAGESERRFAARWGRAYGQSAEAVRAKLGRLRDAGELPALPDPGLLEEPVAPAAIEPPAPPGPRPSPLPDAPPLPDEPPPEAGDGGGGSWWVVAAIAALAWLWRELEARRRPPAEASPPAPAQQEPPPRWEPRIPAGMVVDGEIVDRGR